MPGAIGLIDAAREPVVEEGAAMEAFIDGPWRIVIA
jgi:hypothetical protein